MSIIPGTDYRALFEAAPALYLVLTPDLRIAGASDAYLSATMTTRDGIAGRNIFEAFPDNPDDPEATGVRNLRASLERVLETRQGDAMAVQKYDVRRPPEEGGGFEERYWSPFNSPVLDDYGELVYIIHRVEDVTEFVRLRQARSEGEKQRQELRDRAEEMEAEIYHRAQQVAEANRRLTKANEVLAELYRQVAELVTKVDEETEGEDAGTEPLEPEEMLARISDLITGYKRLEEQLRQAQKMEAVGRLAGGVAHDFNNLLTVITGYASLLRESGASGMETEEIEKAVTRAGALTHKLLAFSRKQVLQTRIINPNAVIAGMEELLRRLITEDILLAVILGPTVGNVKADPHQLEQVIMNLAINARDAMPEGGRLIIESKTVQIGAEFQSLRPGPHVLVVVTDTGVGMDAATAARIFEPFFTTKEMGKGTGLGLATVFGIVEQSGGAITVESAPGAGSTFRVYLPVEAAEVERLPDEPGGQGRTSRTGTVLVVEDETPLRRLVVKVLSRAGHHVLEAANGEEAIALASRQPSIDLLLADVVMPVMSGPDLVARLRATRPELIVVYMSGYDNALIGQKALEHTASFLHKPFTPRALMAKVGALIGAGQADSAGGERSAVG